MKSFMSKAILALTGSGDFIIINNDKIVFKDKNIQVPTKEEIEAKIEELEARDKIDTAVKSLQQLCDKKTQEARAYINGSKVSQEQLDRYNEKYDLAKQYKADGSNKNKLALEAELKNMSVDDLANLIIEKGDLYKDALTTFNSRIEAFRVKVSSIIEAGEIDKANDVISEASKLGATATDDDVKALFN